MTKLLTFTRTVIIEIIALLSIHQIAVICYVYSKCDIKFLWKQHPFPFLFDYSTRENNYTTPLKIHCCWNSYWLITFLNITPPPPVEDLIFFTLPWNFCKFSMELSPLWWKFRHEFELKPLEFFWNVSYPLEILYYLFGHSCGIPFDTFSSSRYIHWKIPVCIPPSPTEIGLHFDQPMEIPCLIMHHASGISTGILEDAIYDIYCNI